MLFWRLSGENACDILLDGMLERVRDGQSLTQQTVDNTLALVHLAFFTDLRLL